MIMIDVDKTNVDSVNDTLSQQTLQALTELQSHPWWCNFKKEKRVETDDKDTKVPYHPSNYRASSSKSASWSTHEAVVRACRIANIFSGIGFFFNGQIYSGIDIDDCVDENGVIAEWAWEIIRLFDSYTEFSTNWRGVHIVVKGLLQIKVLDKDGIEYIKGWKNNPPVGDVPKGKLELYSERRFFVVTGKHVPGTPTIINERQDQLLSILNKFFIEPKAEKEREFYKNSPKLPSNYQPAEIPQNDNELWQIMFREKGNGRRWERLYYGDASDYMGDDGRIDESTADAAIAAKLVFYTRHDDSRVERMMWQTGLARDKWTSHPAYLRQLTIGNAMNTVTNDYDPLYYKREQKDIDTKADGNGTPQNPNSTSSDQQPRSYNLTDLGNAERFAAKYCDKVRWCETWNTWLIFNGKCWEPDKTGRVDQFGKIVVRSIYGEAERQPDDELRKRIAKHANASESSRSVRAMLDRAKSELPAIPDEFNKHFYLLNCNNGTLDLRTGELRPHSPHDMLTRCLKISYNPTARFDKWEAFIKGIFAGDADLIQFMKEALGMSLCGDTSEQCLFICHGNGSNGKTTMLETIRIMMRDYALAANIETFQMRKNEGIKNDVAELYGARFVTASENALGSRLNEAFIKKATGKEPLRARRLHENEFEFMPEFTIWFAVNHKPVVRDTSKGMWRRVHFIPFNVTIDGDQVDKHLGEKLLEEDEGVLAWLVQGCRDWHQRGHLAPPTAVKKATQAYRAEMDIIANFIDEECLIGDGKTVSTKLLLERFESWCNDNGEKYDPKTLRNALRERGLHSTKSTGGRYYWQGIGIIDSGPSGPSGPKNEVITRGENTNQKTSNSRQPTSTMSTSELEFENESGGTSTQESGIPIEYRQLFAEYQASMPISSVKEVFWRVPGGGYPNGPLPPSEHIARMRALLQSGDRGKINAAVEAMKKRLGIEG